MNVTDQKVASWSQAINTILTGLLVAGICWVMLEVSAARERTARIEERLALISINLDDERRSNYPLQLAVIEQRLQVLEARVNAN